MSSEGSSEASEAYESESDEESLPELSPASLPPACSCSSMWKPELVVAEAFEESPRRLVRQLAELLSMPRDDIQAAFDELGLDAERCLPRDLFGLAGHL